MTPLMTKPPLVLLMVVLLGSASINRVNASGVPAPPLSISTASVSDGTLGAAYLQTIGVVGGVAPYSWNLLSGVLPSGLALGPSTTTLVTISGMPAVAQTNVAFTIQVTDARGQSAAQPYEITIKDTIAQTPLGGLHGTVVPCGTPECAASNELQFLGIPYAAPPVRDLRWKPPQPPTPWTGTIRPADTPGLRCVQPNIFNPRRESEDCLYLNVFISSQTPHGQQQPVMVFIHGGANRQGNAVPGLSVPTAPPLATQGVILVTFEYRLGLLGFFTHPLLTAEGDGSSGNYGLRDQVAALAWVQQNIASFGGDPTNVMVFGASAGSSDVEALLTSPLTRGPVSQCGPSQSCFSSAGMESGSEIRGQFLSLADKEAQDAPLVAGLTATIDGQPVSCDTAADVLACLRAVPAVTLVTNPSAAAWYSGVNGASFAPVLIVNLEPDAVPVNPLDWLLENDGSPVPLLLGSNREDASMGPVPSWCPDGSLGPPLCPTEDPTVLPQIDEPGYEAAIHAEFDPLVGGGGANTMLTTLYPASAFDAPVWALIAVDSDFTVGASCAYREVAHAATGGAPILDLDSNAANAAAVPPEPPFVRLKGRSPVWRYVYSHTLENDPNLTPYRSFHGSELAFVLGDPSVVAGNDHTPTAAELALSAQMMGYWTRFAATGNPNGSGAARWPRYNANEHMLQIDDTSTQIKGYRTAQCDFFDGNVSVLSTVQ